MAQIQTPPDRSILAKIFVSPDEPRLRAGWRLLLQTILMVVLLIIIGIVVGIIYQVLLEGPPGASIDLFISQVIEFIGFFVSIYIARRLLDKRSFVSLGLKMNAQTLMDILAGIVITFFMMGLIYLIEVAAGWLTFEAFAWEVEPVNIVITSVAAFFLVFILVGWNEELLSRGYHLQTIASGINLFWGVILSSAVFGALHLGNPNATWVSAAGILLAGLFLAYAYMRTGQLWLSIGLHIGWNFFEGVVFGFPVSGLDIYQLLRIQVQGPELWTGGAFGPEAGLVVIPGLLLGAALIYLYTKMLRSQGNSV